MQETIKGWHINDNDIDNGAVRITFTQMRSDDYIRKYVKRVLPIEVKKRICPVVNIFLIRDEIN